MCLQLWSAVRDVPEASLEDGQQSQCRGGAVPPVQVNAPQRLLIAGLEL